MNKRGSTAEQKQTIVFEVTLAIIARNKREKGGEEQIN